MDVGLILLEGVTLAIVIFGALALFFRGAGFSHHGRRPSEAMASVRHCSSYSGERVELKGIVLRYIPFFLELCWWLESR
jgi:hypothetical protein